jgi:hypothetical protein
MNNKKYYLTPARDGLCAVVDECELIDNLWEHRHSFEFQTTREAQGWAAGNNISLWRYTPTGDVPADQIRPTTDQIESQITATLQQVPACHVTRFTWNIEDTVKTYCTVGSQWLGDVAAEQLREIASDTSLTVIVCAFYTDTQHRRFTFKPEEKQS